MPNEERPNKDAPSNKDQSSEQEQRRAPPHERDLLDGGATDQETGSFARLPEGPSTAAPDPDEPPPHPQDDETTPRLHMLPDQHVPSQEAAEPEPSEQGPPPWRGALESTPLPSSMGRPSESESSGIYEAPVDRRDTHEVYEVKTDPSQEDEVYQPSLAWTWPPHPSLARIVIYAIGIAAFLIVAWPARTDGLWVALSNLSERQFAAGVALGLASAVVPTALLLFAIAGQRRYPSPLSRIELTLLTSVSFSVTLLYVAAPLFGSGFSSERAFWLLFILSLFPSQAILLWLRRGRHDRSWLVGDPRGYVFPFFIGLLMMVLLSVGAGSIVSSQAEARFAGWQTLRRDASGPDCAWLADDASASEPGSIERGVFETDDADAWVRGMMACVDSRVQPTRPPLVKRLNTQDELPRLDFRNPELIEEWSTAIEDLRNYRRHLWVMPEPVQVRFASALVDRAERICGNPFRMAEAHLLLAVSPDGSDARQRCSEAVAVETETWLKDAIGTLARLAEKTNWNDASVEAGDTLGPYLGEPFRAIGSGKNRPMVRDVPLVRPDLDADGSLDGWEHPLTVRVLPKTEINPQGKRRRNPPPDTRFGPELYLIAFWEKSAPAPSWSTARTIAQMIHERWRFGSSPRDCSGPGSYFEGIADGGEEWYLNVGQGSIKTGRERKSRSTILRAATKRLCPPSPR